MNDWRGIEEFMAVVEAGTFTLAADQLGVGTSQISKKISELEERLGLKLLLRTTRTVTPTDEGLEYYERCKDALALLADTESSLKNAGPSTVGELKVIISGIHQPRFQVAVLAGFCTKYPKIKLSVTFSDDMPDFVSADFDAALVLGELNNEELNAERLVTFPYCICAHPDYLKEFGMPLSPFDLQNFNCITGTSDKWLFRTGQGELIAIKVKGSWRTGNGETQLQAARYGMGLAQIPEFYAEPFIESGKLVKVLQNWEQVGQSIWLVLPKRRHVSSRVKLFRDYIKEKSVLLTLESKKTEQDIMKLFHHMEVKLETSEYPLLPLDELAKREQ